MKIPPRLMPLIEANLISEVVGQLQSGKEADVYVVRTGDEMRCAKVYKEAKNRSFKNKADYTEGRHAKGSRRGRAMAKNSRFGKKEREEEWQSTEVESLYYLGSKGISVPQPLGFYEGVLLLEMVTDEHGDPAKRLHDVSFSREEAIEGHKFLISQIVKMLCEGMIHGDLSEYNVLASERGLVIIDFPQSVQSTAQNAYRILERDVNQISSFFSAFAPEIATKNFAKEIWKLYENGKLKPDTILTGNFKEPERKANITQVLENVIDARKEEEMKRERKGS